MYHVTEHDCSRATQTLVSAFMDYELFTAIAPAASTRQTLLEYTFQYMLDPSIQHITASSPDLEGVAVWYEPGKPFDHIEDIPGNLPGIAELNAFLFFTTAFIKHHIREPVWYLSAVGVSADKQQQGIGSRLLQEQLEIIDKTYGTPCVLDTQRPVDCKVYERLGFRVMEYTHTPGGLAPYYLMVRPAQGQ